MKNELSTGYDTKELAVAAAQGAADMIETLEARKLELEIAELERGAAKVEKDARHNGFFHFVGSVHETRVHSVMIDIEEYCRANPGAPVKILLNSAGGNVIDGLAFCDYLKLLSSRGHKTTIIATGIAASMAGVILQCADERVLTKRAYLSIHEVSSVVQGSLTDNEDNIRFTKQLQRNLEEILCERSELTIPRLKSMWRRKDVNLSAFDALKLGLIDRIEGE